MGEVDWQEGGRAYVGIHELVSSLPQLRHLWVNERVLAVSASDNRDDVWAAHPFDGESHDAIMSRTVASPQWELLRHTFKELESLRVGFGPITAAWVTKVLSLCDHTKLKAFGFDWEWEPGSNKPVRLLVASTHTVFGYADQFSRACFPNYLWPFRGSSLWQTFIFSTHTRRSLPPSITVALQTSESQCVAFMRAVRPKLL